MLWPGLLGKNKYEFARTYCSVKTLRGCQGKVFQDFSKGTRLDELNILLKQTVMIRRLKKQVLAQLPPKRRQVISLQLKRSDVISAMAVCAKSDPSGNDEAGNEPLQITGECGDVGQPHNSRVLSRQEIGVAKVRGFLEWLAMHPIFAEQDCMENAESSVSSHKMIIFAHYHKVLDRVQEFVCDKGIEFVRIDGDTSARDRQLAVCSFQSSEKVKIAIIGIKVASFGIDLSSAQNVVFLELPWDPAHMGQAEDRAHRRGQTKAVNIYIFCAKDTSDESHWRYLNKSFRRVSSTTDGKYGAMQEIEVENVSYLHDAAKDQECVVNPTFGEAIYSDISGLERTVSPNSDSDPDSWSTKENNGRAKMGNKKSEELNDIGGSSEEDSVRAEADSLSDLEILKCSSPGGGLDAIVEGKTECGEITSQNFEGNEDKYQLDKAQKMIFERSDELIESKSSRCTPFEHLRFEVSQYTGRIHLYTCVPGVDSRPKPLFENFRPEDLDSSNILVSSSSRTVHKCIKDNPAYRQALLQFVNEWNNLKPIQKNKLLGRPLQLPLCVELCCFTESLNHDSEGLLKGGSKRRTTPLHEIAHKLPSNALWKKVQLCGGYSKTQKEYRQAWTVAGEPLCKLCQTPCESKNSKTPEYFEDLFCKLNCYEEYRLRTSTRFLRQELFQIERGICRICQLDCHQLVVHIKPLSQEKRQMYIEKNLPNLARRKKLLEKLVQDPSEGNAWHADHLVPVYRGGGECRLENMRTLCVACHADVTAVQSAERRLEMIKAKKQLKITMNELRVLHKTENLDSDAKDKGDLENQNAIDEGLLLEVPGSAYSRSQNGATEN